MEDKKAEGLEKILEALSGDMKSLNGRVVREIRAVSDNLYSQIESLISLNKRLSLRDELPPLRKWPASPDFLLHLHKWVCDNKPKIVVETGSGATTLVIADALRRNGYGKLYSFEHLDFYANQTSRMLRNECLSAWVELKLSELVAWNDKHLATTDQNQQINWYNVPEWVGENIDLLVVDGPPASTCNYARYPAMSVFYKALTPSAEVWMDDANRPDEKEICQSWADEYSLVVDFYPLEKGLAILKIGN